MDQTEGIKWTGRFNISPEKEISGDLTLAGPKTSLYLHDKDKFGLHNIQNQCIKGRLHDLTKVTLIDCVTAPEPGYARRNEEIYYFASVFPHYVVYGDHHINPGEEEIAEVHFVIDDATTLFYDFDAFGSVINARPFIDTIARANRLDREIVTGPHPVIAYFTGKTEIFAADTVLGRISARHSPTYSLGGPSGVRIDNIIIVSIAFRKPVAFESAMLDTWTLSKYLGILVGRPQNLGNLSVRLHSVQDRRGLNVYWCMPPKREVSLQGRDPHPAEVLLDAVRNTKEFSQVLANWLERQHEWRAARGRFFSSFAEQRHYSTDRLIGAANMFDILPDSGVPPDIQVSKELSDAGDAARTAFQTLPRSPERDSILGALGRIGKASLKQKVRHRAQQVIEAVGDKFSELLTVTDEAINCRNYYVHGGESRFDYEEHFDRVIFFTDTLEFVFAASDLIDAGWNIGSWMTVPTAESHPFGGFRINYARQLQLLKDLLPR
jgi:hypothetical protein